VVHFGSSLNIFWWRCPWVYFLEPRTANIWRVMLLRIPYGILCLFKVHCNSDDSRKKYLCKEEFSCDYMIISWLFSYRILISPLKWKKRSERRKHCALAVVMWSQKFSPGRRPLPRGAGWPTFNQLEMVTTSTYRPSLVKIGAHNFELSW